MDENWKKQPMPLILAPTHLHNGFNEKGRKTNGTIGDEGVKKETLVYRVHHVCTMPLCDHGDPHAPRDSNRIL